MVARKLSICLLLLAACLFGACSRQPDPPPRATATIHFAVREYELALYEELVSQFSTANPDVRVELLLEQEILQNAYDGDSVTVSTDDDLLLAREADVFQPVYAPTGSQTGALLELTPFLAADDHFDGSDFFPGLLQRFQWQGGTWAIPLQSNYDLIYYNKALFDDAGIIYPQPGWTWDDFLAAAKALTRSEGGEVVQWGYLAPNLRPLYFVQGRTAPLIDPNTVPPTVHLDTPEVAAALQWYLDLFQVHGLTHTIPQLDAERLIRDRKVGMWPASSALWDSYPPQIELGAAPYPIDSTGDKTTPIVYTPALAISAGTAHPDAAWRLVDFLSRQPPVRFDFQALPTTLPARRSVAAASGFWDDVDEELGAVLSYVVDHAYVPVRLSFTRAAESILAGETTVDAALAQLQTRIETRLAGETEATPAAAVVMSVPAAEQTDGEAETLTFKIVDIEQLETYRELAEAFHSANPKIKVIVSPAEFNAESPVLAALAAESDCFQAFPVFDPVGAAAVLSLEPFFDGDAATGIGDFYPRTIAEMTYQGGLRGLPVGVTVSVIAYNKALFDAAGMAYPVAGWTLEDFMQTAVSLTQGSDDTRQYGFVPDLYEPTDLADMLAATGAQLVDADTSPPALQLTHPSVVATLQSYVDLTLVHQAKPLFLTAAEGDAWTFYEERRVLIENGQAAMWSDSGGFAGGVAVTVAGEAEALPAAVGVAPLPFGPDGASRGSYRTTSALFISASSASPQACWQWITFLSKEAVTPHDFPARRSIAASDAYRLQIGTERAAVYEATVAGANAPSFYEPMIANPWLDASWRWLAEAYDAAVHEGIGVEEALANAQANADQYRDCLISSDGLHDWNQIQICYEEASNSSR